MVVVSAVPSARQRPHTSTGDAGRDHEARG